MGHAARVSFGVAVWIVVAGEVFACWLQKEPAEQPDAPLSSSKDGPLTIHIVGPDDAPIEEAVVEMWRNRLPLEDEDDSQRDRRTGKELGRGEYQFDRPPPGSYSIRVRAAGFATEWCVHWDHHCAEPFRVRLRPEHPTSGVVLGSDGTPIEGAEIHAGLDLWVLDSEYSEARSDFAGRFTLHGLDERELEVCVSADGFTDDEKEKVTAGTADLWFNLTPAAPFVGRIVADDDGRPVAGAKVHVSCLRCPLCEDRTDAQGFFQIRRIPAHCRSVFVFHEDFIRMDLNPEHVQQTVPREQRAIRLQRGCSVTGKVIDAATGVPIAGATVVTWPPGEKEGPCSRKSVKSDAGGDFQLKGLLEGAWTIHIRKKGYLETRIPVELGAERNDRPLFLRLESGGSITGRVLDSDGNPVENAQVTLAADSDAGGNGCRVMAEQTVTTDPEGRFRLEGIPAYSTSCLLASHWDFTAQWMDGIRLGEGGLARGIEMRLFKGGAIHGRVLDPRGAGVPLAYVAVELTCPECLQRNFDVRCLLGSWAVTDEAGDFTLTRVPPGSQQLDVLAQDDQFLTHVSTVVREGETTDGVDIVMDN